MPGTARRRGVIFDLSGCLLDGSGAAVPGAAQAVAAVRNIDAPVCFVSNDPRSVDDVRGRLTAAGIAAESHEVLTAGVAAAEYLRRHHPGAPVLLVGDDTLRQDLLDAGLTPTDEPPAAAVLVALTRDFSYALLTAACRAVWDRAGFFATSMDRRVRRDGLDAPATGALASAVAWATGVRPTVLGKPSAWIARLAARRLGVPVRSLVIVGDQLDVDIRMARAAGATGVLVLTGFDRREDARPQRPRPHAVLPSVADLPAWLQEGRR